MQLTEKGTPFWGRLRRILCVFMAMAMMITIIAPVTTQAASKKQKLLLYVGEEYTLRDDEFIPIKSVSSSKTSVATIKKGGQDIAAYIVKAKKAGTTTLTISGKTFFNKNRKVQIALTVKKPDITFKEIRQPGSAYDIVEINNKTSTTFEKLTFHYSIKDSSGKLLSEGTDIASDVMAGKKAYKEILVGAEAVDSGSIDYSKSVFQITGYDRHPNWTYKVLTAKQLSVKMVDRYEFGPYNYFKFSVKNKVNQKVTCWTYILYYDENNTIIGMEQYPIDLDKKENKKTNEYSFFPNTYLKETYDHYKIVYQGYYKYSK